MARTALGRPAKGLARFFMDCGWHRHPRYAGLTAEALVTFQAIISYSTEHATDGRAPADPEDLSVAIGVRVSWVRKALPKLLERGALVPVGDHLEVPNWADHNPTAVEIEAFTEERSKAGSRGNHERWHVKAGVWKPDCIHCQHDGPPPDESHSDPPDDPDSDRSSDPTAIANPSHGMGWDGRTTGGCTTTSVATDASDPDDDGIPSLIEQDRQLATQALTEAARRRHERTTKAETEHGRHAHLEACIDSALTERMEHTLGLIARQPDITVDQLVDLLEPPPAPPASGPAIDDTPRPLPPPISELDLGDTRIADDDIDRGKSRIAAIRNSRPNPAA